MVWWRYRERYGNKLFRSAFRFLGSREDAEELVQDVFLRVWKGAPTFRGDAALGTWIYSILRFGAISMRRSKRSKIDQQMVSFDPAIMDHPTVGDQHAALVERAYRDALQTLPVAEQRTVEMLRLGYTWAETMAATDAPKKTLWNRVNRARKRLTSVRHAV